MGFANKAAYIKGLIKGLELDESTKEGKVLRAMSKLMMEMAVELDDLGQDVDAISEEIEDLDDFLREVLLSGKVDEEEDGGDDEDGEDITGPCYEVDCPNCGETVYVTEADLEEKEAFCTSCGKSFGIELAEEEGDEEPARYEVTCQDCGAVTVLEEDDLVQGDIRCAGCGKLLDLEPGGEE